jgi:aspartyl-tRNA(Asn)/glutamyl-tRNA(Gln) amidotransferase subunit B
VVRLTRIHLEEDVAKSTHFETSTGIDFNRAGTPLMEIVSEPDIANPEEAFAYLTALQQILVYGGVSDADMEKGQLRCDCNVSVAPEGSDQLGTKIEIKNMNSISAVRRALAFEIDRQIGVVKSGGQLVQSTRRWDDDAGQTFEMRTKGERARLPILSRSGPAAGRHQRVHGRRCVPAVRSFRMRNGIDSSATMA